MSWYEPWTWLADDKPSPPHYEKDPEGILDFNGVWGALNKMGDLQLQAYASKALFQYSAMEFASFALPGETTRKDVAERMSKALPMVPRPLSRAEHDELRDATLAVLRETNALIVGNEEAKENLKKLFQDIINNAITATHTLFYLAVGAAIVVGGVLIAKALHESKGAAA